MFRTVIGTRRTKRASKRIIPDCSRAIQAQIRDHLSVVKERGNSRCHAGKQASVLLNKQD